jgi:hypothetical protein
MKAEVYPESFYAKYVPAASTKYKCMEIAQASRLYSFNCISSQKVRSPFIKSDKQCVLIDSSVIRCTNLVRGFTEGIS